ncbi:MAG: protein kinase domain-containing protein [Planctomycetota bacterium]|jgi:serine/threonine protein kinase
MRTSPTFDLEAIKDRVSAQLSGAGWDTSENEVEVDSLADRISAIAKKVCDDDGYIRHAGGESFVKLDSFIGAGGQYIVFSGTMDFDRIDDYTQFWIPRRAHELMDQEGGALGQALEFARRAAREAANIGAKKVHRELMSFLKKNYYFTGGRCAVKVSYESLSSVPRAKREAFTIGMYHPNIVYTLAEGKTVGNRIYRIMELIKDPIPIGKISSTLTLDEVIKATMKVAQVLEYIDKKGAIHRDIKPENILMGRGRRDVHPKVTDFGLMKMREFNEVFSFLTASSCVLLGTPEFIAPEQAQNPAAADIRADLYCLGATVYFWWTGQSPNPVREDVSPRERVHLKFLNAISRERKPLAPMSSKASRDLFRIKARRFQAVIAGLLRTDPKLRYQKPAEAVEDLNRVLAGKRPVHLRESWATTLTGAFSGARGLARWQKIALGTIAAVLMVVVLYVLCNEVPGMRNRLPTFLQKAIPWYRTLKS